jgi:hypothetical protein
VDEVDIEHIMNTSRGVKSYGMRTDNFSYSIFGVLLIQFAAGSNRTNVL